MCLVAGGGAAEVRAKVSAVVHQIVTNSIQVHQLFGGGQYGGLGAVSQSVAYILEILEYKSNIKYKKDAEVNVFCDYLSDSSSADVSLSFGLRVWHLLDILFRVAIGYVSKKAKKQK